MEEIKDFVRGIAEPNPRITPIGWILIVGVTLAISTTLTFWGIAPLMSLGVQMVVILPIWIAISGGLLSISSLLFLDRKKAFCRILSGTAAITAAALLFTLLLLVVD